MKEIKEWIAEISDSNNEIWSSDIEGYTREEVIKKGMKLAKKNGLANFRIGKQTFVDIPTIDINNILESAYKQIYDKVGEFAEDFLENITVEQQKELEENLNKVFLSWIKKYDLEPAYYNITDYEIIKVK